MLLAALVAVCAGCYASRTVSSGHSELDAAGIDTGARSPLDAAGADTRLGVPIDAAAVDVVPRSPFAGFYEGTYMGAESGTVFLEIRPDGSLTIELRGPRGVERHDGTIRVDGALNAAGAIGALLVRFRGRFRGAIGSHVGTGTWRVEGTGLAGTWQLHQVG